ncbi:serine/threonine-protein kinase [Streptomyces vinaceus]|uniref:serine/threonine-protein kinase n=1 Tax=Streptomyces vinaceus TaxID=1960 RepID=UPI0035D763A3
MDAVAGQMIGGRYRLARLLGSGGFGRVWSAEDTVLGVPVAVKELRLGHVPPGERQELLVRAAREARHAARLRDHPNIVPVYDVVEVDAAVWIVMRLVEGHSLAEQLKMNGALTETRTRAIAQALLDALSFVHEADITHRDVKPANIMLTSSGDVLLADFGIAVDRADTRLTRTDLVIGTPGYTAPERWAGAEPSGASDLFSLGVTLYETVEGRLPFPRDEPLAALRTSPPPPRHAGLLAPLIMRLLEGDPARRPTSTEAFSLLGHQTNKPPTKPGNEGNQETAQVTISLTASEILPQVVKKQAGEGAVLGMLVGASVYLFSPSEFLPEAFGIRAAAWGVTFLIGVVSKAVYGLFLGRSATSDVITVNHDGFTITRNDGGRSLTIEWSTVDGIGLFVGSIRVWFRGDSVPTPDWIREHGIQKSLPDGSLVVYGDDHASHIPVKRLHEALRTFAGARYRT